jgi:hypothetical protein
LVYTKHSKDRRQKMGRFLLALSVLLVFVTATGFCQSGFSPEQKSEIEEIVKNAIRNELQGFYRQQPVSAYGSSAPTTNISTNARSITPGRNELTEPGISRQEDIVALIASRNRGTPRWYIEDIVIIYFAEAKFEQINHDIAIAQMLYATDYLNNIQRTAVHNYSGMLNASFCDRTTGIRAHIQHLKFYAVGSLVDNRRNVDPRYPILKANNYLGKVSTLEDLCWKWSESPGYLSGIRSKLDEIRCSAIARR